MSEQKLNLPEVKDVFNLLPEVKDVQKAVKLTDEELVSLTVRDLNRHLRSLSPAVSQENSLISFSNFF